MNPDVENSSGLSQLQDVHVMAKQLPEVECHHLFLKNMKFWHDFSFFKVDVFHVNLWPNLKTNIGKITNIWNNIKIYCLKITYFLYIGIIRPWICM